MALVFRVSVPFKDYVRGSLIADPAVLAQIKDTEHESHGHFVDLPDDHHAVMPHLDEEHPVRKAFVENIVSDAPPSRPAVPEKPAERAPQTAPQKPAVADKPPVKSP